MTMNASMSAEVETDVEEIVRDTPIPGHEASHFKESIHRSFQLSKGSIDDEASYSSATASDESEWSQDDDNNSGNLSGMKAAAITGHSCSQTSHVTNPIPALQPQQDGRIPRGYPIPRWFPRNIKAMFEVDRKGGALRFKV